MDDERIERALRQGPPDEPAYERSIAVPARRTRAYRGAVRRAGVAPRYGFATLVAAAVVLLVAPVVIRPLVVAGPGSSTPPDLLGRLRAEGTRTDRRDWRPSPDDRGGGCCHRLRRGRRARAREIPRIGQRGTRRDRRRHPRRDRGRLGHRPALTWSARGSGRRPPVLRTTRGRPGSSATRRRRSDHGRPRGCDDLRRQRHRRPRVAARRGRERGREDRTADRRYRHSSERTMRRASRPSGPGRPPPPSRHNCSTMSSPVRACARWSRIRWCRSDA